jgi:hypothetical protein
LVVIFFPREVLMINTGKLSGSYFLSQRSIDDTYW